jgi:adenosine deaminase
VRQTAPGLTLEAHALHRMLEARMSVCICTDNRTFSNTTSSKELRLARTAFNVTPRLLKDIVIGGFKRFVHSF